MFHIRRITALALMFCSASALATAVDHGIVRFDGSGGAILVTAQPLAPGAMVEMQFPDARQRAACCKRLPSSSFSLASATSGVFASNEVSGERALIYTVRIPGQWAITPFVGVAALAPYSARQGVRGQLASSNAKGRMTQASLCTGHEGVHLLEHRGTKLLTHLYLSLGYEVATHTCDLVGVSIQQTITP